MVDETRWVGVHNVTRQSEGQSGLNKTNQYKFIQKGTTEQD